MVSLCSETQIVTGYVSTHDALDTIIMSDLAVLTALVQLLVVTAESQGADMPKAHSALDNINRMLCAYN